MQTKVVAKPSKHSLLLKELTALGLSLQPHAQLPSERQLAEQFKVSRMTLRHAIEVLQARGYFYKIPSKGLFVSEPRMVTTSDVTSFSEVSQHRGDHATLVLHLADRVHATEEVSKALFIRKGDWVYRLEISHLDGDTVMATETAYVPGELAPGLLDQDLSKNLSVILADHYEKPILRVEYRVRAVMPPEKFRERLHLDSGAPVLEFHATGIISKERAGFLVISYKRGDKYDLTYQLEI